MLPCRSTDRSTWRRRTNGFRSLHLHHEAVTEQDLIRPVLELIVRKANARHLRDSLRAARNGGAQPRELSED